MFGTLGLIISKNGSGCPACGKERASSKIRKSREQVLTEFAAKRLDLGPIGEYFGTMERMTVRGKVCGHVWEVKPNHFFSSMSKRSVYINRGIDFSDRYADAIRRWGEEH